MKVILTRLDGREHAFEIVDPVWRDRNTGALLTEPALPAVCLEADLFALALDFELVSYRSVSEVAG